MTRIDRVVWKGKFIKTDRMIIGRLVYRNDEPFLKQRKKIIRQQWIAIIIAFGAILFFLLGLRSTPFVLLVFLWVVMFLIDVVQFNFWKGVDRGVVVHENGLDILDYRTFTLGRIFVPREEISHFGLGWFRFTIYLKRSNKILFCHRSMVDNQTIWHIGKLLEGKLPEPKGPELKIYGDDGAYGYIPRYGM
jgi:hypothetical protein